ncbi:MAG TPA: signal recognition particle-docking protein FtsY [Actinomycetota bacterium]|nr:signal recognition particle-docking protein FtsY [Actinomycetota bacterium]
MSEGPGFVLLYVLIVLVVLGFIAGGVILTRRRGGVDAPERPPEPAPPEPSPPDQKAPPVEAPPQRTVEAPPRPAPPPVVSTPPPFVEAPPAEAPPVEAPVPAVEEAAAPRPLRERLGRARSSFGQALVRVFKRGGLTESDWEDVEAVLLQADVGVAATTRILDDLRSRSRDVAPEALLDVLRSELLQILGDADRSLHSAVGGLTIWLVTGVNGTGKTTTIGKLALREGRGGRKVILAAADTFRAAADTQLERWAERSGAEVVKQAPGADPAAVAFDGVKAASARSADLLIVDTAGRLHTKRNLMEELSKIRRVIEREAGPPSEVLLVLDATTGQNGIAQARAFTEAADVTGVVLTKLDGTAKGGIVIAVQQELGIPVKLVGVGEGAEDLEPFDPAGFIDALLG